MNGRYHSSGWNLLAGGVLLMIFGALMVEFWPLSVGVLAFVLLLVLAFVAGVQFVSAKFWDGY